MTSPSWRRFLHTWRDVERVGDRQHYLDAMGARHAASADQTAGSARGRLSMLRGPLSWLSVRPAMQTADGRIVARPTRISWGRDGVWLSYPMCRIGLGHWAMEEWLAGAGWVRLHEGPRTYLRKRHAVLPGMDPIWRWCGVEDLLPSVVGVRHIRTALVHLQPIEAEVRAARVTAADLLPLLECCDVGVRDGALRAVSFLQSG